jgi:hypothetical protein
MEALTLNNRIEMPVLGLGVYQTPPGETRNAVAITVETFGREIPEA